MMIITHTPITAMEMTVIQCYPEATAVDRLNCTGSCLLMLLEKKESWAQVIINHKHLRDIETTNIFIATTCIEKFIVSSAAVD